VAEVKNGSLVLPPGSYKLIITSNFSPDEIFRNEQDLAAIKRRVHVINWRRENVGIL
jgi:hypothetical protein